VTDVDIDTALEWRGRTVVDRSGEKIGTLRDVYLDDQDRPHWGSVATGLFGRNETLVPLTAIEVGEDELRLPYPRDLVEAAPNVDPDVQLSPEDEERLAGHFEPEPEPDPEPEPEPEPQADNAMTRSEEEVSVRKEARPRERVRLKKYVVTDYVKKKVPVQREEIRLEQDPPAGGDDG
jgi:hypothetical protein